MTTEKMSVEQALDLMLDVYMTSRQREAFDTLRAELAGIKARELKLLNHFKSCADHSGYSDVARTIYRAVSAEIEDAIALDRAREVPREGE